MQNNSRTNFDALIKSVDRISKLVLIAVLLALLIIVALLSGINKKAQPGNSAGPQPDKDGLFTQEARLVLAAKRNEMAQYWQAPDTANWKTLSNAHEIRYGKNLIENTAFYFGENGTIAKHFSNGMNCQNCHLQAGTKIWGNNFSAVASTYPKYRARSGSIESISKRINDCFERSLNGKSLDTAGKEMKAIVAYIHWLGSHVEKGKRPAGSGFKKLNYLSRAASPRLGKIVFEMKCGSCHGANGEGRKNSASAGYKYPPLWGEYSYNTAAGLYRLSNFAGFVKYNMPQGVDYLSTQLSDEEAWDVAAFVNSQARPGFNTSRDWPNLEEKPIDYPFGPYADGFNEIQHKYGPFQTIVDKRNSSKRKKL